MSDWQAMGDEQRDGPRIEPEEHRLEREARPSTLRSCGTCEGRGYFTDYTKRCGLTHRHPTVDCDVCKGSGFAPETPFGREIAAAFSPAALVEVVR